MEPTEYQQSSDSLSKTPSAETLAPGSVAPLPPKNTVFFGRFGLRAGYGIAIYVVIFLLVGTLAGIFAVAVTGHLQQVVDARNYAHTHPGAPKVKLDLPFTAGLLIAQEGALFAALLLMCFVFSKAEKRPFSVYGIGRFRMADFVRGALVGVAALAALAAVLRAAHLLVFDGQNVHGATAVKYGLLWLLGFLLVGFAEEYEFRGYLQYTLMRGFWGLAERIAPSKTQDVAFWMAATLWSVVFLAAHLGNAGENKFGLFAVFLAGMTLAFTLWWTGSLWWGIGWHMAWDWAQSFLFGVADSGNISVGRLFVTHPAGNPLLSGGADGPEGSVLVIAALLLTVLLCRFTTRRGTLPSPQREGFAYDRFTPTSESDLAAR